MTSSAHSIPSLQHTVNGGGVATFSLHRAHRKNALDRDLVLALADALEELPQKPQIRVVVLWGAGGSFCSGADLTTITDAQEDEWAERVDEFHRLIRGVVHAPQPVIAAVEGPAAGFGADLALCCDLRVLSHQAFLEESFIRIGLMPDGGGTYWMDKYLGPRAFEVLATGMRLSAETCEQWGLANRLVAEGQTLSEAQEWGQTLAQAAPLSLRAMKSALRARDRECLDAVLAREKAGQLGLLRSRDFREGVSAFLAKRRPRFSGE